MQDAPGGAARRRMIYRSAGVEAGASSDAQPAPRYSPSDVERRRRLLRRGLPALGGVALVVLVLALLLDGGPGAAERATAKRYATLWAQGDYGRMYALLDGPARARTSFQDFAAAYRAAAETATLGSLVVGKVGNRSGDAIPVTLLLRTRVFGLVHGTLELPVSGSGDAMRVAWRPNAVFPGLGQGQQLARQTTLPTRATLLARDGTVLAAGADRHSAAPAVSGEIVGSLQPAPADEAGQLRALGYPPGALVGSSGLERVFETELAGQPGGTLTAGDRVVARSVPRAAPPVRTTISPRSSRPRSPRSPAATAASRRSTRAAARCWRSPASPSRRSSRPARRSRSSRSPARSSRTSRSRRRPSPSKTRPSSRA